MPKNKNPKIHSGQVIPAKGGSVAHSPKRQNFLGTLFDSRRWVWITQLWTKQTEALTGLVEAENKLADAYKERGRKIDDLKDIQTILNADREARKAAEFEAKTRREAAQRAYRERFQDNAISQKRKDQEIKRLDVEAERIAAEKLEVEIRKLRNEKHLQIAKAEVAGEQKKKPGPSTTDLFKEKDKIDKEYAKRKAAIDKSSASAEEKKSSMKLLNTWRETEYEKLFGEGENNRT